MQNRMKKCATVVLLAATTVAFVPMTAMADRAEAQHSRVDRGAKVKVVKQQRHRHAVGQRLRKQDVVVVKNWRARGLRARAGMKSMSSMAMIFTLRPQRRCWSRPS
ncbi:hypothetical protein [Sulfitobacter profundi]|uniref:Uncharacterized protein n=1 Tax=Sulfitobacter profundi TaxID=2679961 RepID=A0ABW1Z0C3_9RHOB